MPGAESRPTQDPADLTGFVLAARDGDERAWSALVGEYAPRVFALARSRLRNHDAAEEVTQSVFVTIAIKLRDGQYDEHGKFEPWLFRIAMNRIRDAIRRSRRQGVETDVRLADRSEAPALGAAPQTLDSLREALENLTRPDRNIIELRYHAGLSFRQIADLLGEPIGTLLARHHRALRKLRRVLEGSDSEPAEGESLQAATRGTT